MEEEFGHHGRIIIIIIIIISRNSRGVEQNRLLLGKTDPHVEYTEYWLAPYLPT
jgi:hypothetical protein